MAFQLFWGNLTAEFTETVREALDVKLGSKFRPSFIGEVKVLALDFGTVPPRVELTDLADPYPEFYQYDGELCREGFYSHSAHPFSPNCVHPDCGAENSTANAENYTETETSRSYSLPRSPPTTGIQHPGLCNPGCGWEGELDVDSDQNSEELASGAYFGAAGVPGNPQFSLHPSPTSPPSLAAGAHHNLHSKHDEDIQAHLKVAYDGDMSLTISTSLNIDYPAKGFMSLPIGMVAGAGLAYDAGFVRYFVGVLSDTSYWGYADAVVAFLQSKVGFSLLPPKDPSFRIAFAEAALSLLRALKVESVIGEASRHALRNVDRVASFIQDEVRRGVEARLVFPNFVTYPRGHDA
ncbi:Mitochondrial distribution and morphology protein 12 [Massospora cicadina]|nr:Mitochondrial distribution and morphology protein 12 [Massospora cicadina]